MGTDEDIQARLALIEKQDKIAEAKGHEANKLLKMPFHLRIQEKTQEDILERVHSTQKSTFERICKKEKIHKEDWNDEFCLFWDGFLKGEFKSINQYLKRKTNG